MAKVVVDTNVFVVARFKKEGASFRLIHDCIVGAVRALYTSKIKAETERVLEGTAASQTFMDRVDAFYYTATEVEDTIDLKVCEDPSDDMFFECAVAGCADYIISEDKHIRKLDGYGGIAVRNASEFYRENNIPKRR
jgi:putative PIN family toxin of toxin-antitoxin system